MKARGARSRRCYVRTAAISRCGEARRSTWRRDRTQRRSCLLYRLAVREQRSVRPAQYTHRDRYSSFACRWLVELRSRQARTALLRMRITIGKGDSFGIVRDSVPPGYKGLARLLMKHGAWLALATSWFGTRRSPHEGSSRG